MDKTTKFLLVLVVILFNYCPVLAETIEDDGDPWEPFNRAIFSFNDTVDEYFFEPIAKGYNYVMPSRVKIGVNNLFENLSYPMYLLSDLVQLKFEQVGDHTGRFLINSTAGVLGVMDVAKDVGLAKHYEDFGVALGYDGIPGGPYLVLPFFGPGNVRDTVGKVVDNFMTPFFYIDNPPVTISLTGLSLIDTRRTLIDAVDLGKESSLDYYSFVRSSYHQRRQSLIYDGEPPEEEEQEEEMQDNTGNKGAKE
jgi:phospholipid-binding lipoprotein MlaA